MSAGKESGTEKEDPGRAGVPAGAQKPAAVSAAKDFSTEKEENPVHAGVPAGA